MTTQGSIILVLFALGILVWVLDLIRRERLYVGYGVVFVFGIAGSIVVLAFPPLLAAITHLVGAVFPASALTLLALSFIVILLIYVFTQVTIVSNRLAVVVQELALRQAMDQGRDAESARSDADGASSHR